MKNDEITKKLSDTLKEFLGFIKNDLQKKVLELDSNVKSKEYFENLKRVSNSLEQYIQKDVGLFYIGFLGSYSSGKSSTINSILQLWNTDKARLVNNNPTDNCITLITNQNNVNNVFTFAKEGAVPIRTNTNFDTSFLENVVIMDTPGSGDPNIIESIVRDSLPLCDLIIYTLNATAPFTDIDRPFLEAQQSKLQNIPIIFVLTRADEYKLDKSKKIIDANFDIEKCHDDLKTIVTRINEAIKISNFKESEFTIIDNKEDYNIDLLINRINLIANNNNENLILLHNHKLTYFRNEIKAIHKYYYDLSIDKIDKCEKFIVKANDNIEYFDEQIEISKMKFRSLWNENNQIFTRIYDGTVKGYIAGLVTELDEIRPLINIPEYIYFRSKVKDILSEKSKELARKIAKEIDEKTNSSFTDLKNKVINLLNEDTLLMNDNLSFEENITHSLEFPLEKQEYINELFSISKNKLIDYNKKLNDINKRVNKSLQQSKPLDSINENIILYNKAFIEILNLYYDAIKMYNVVAFSFEVKNYISELGLAREFDRLESGEINKTRYNLIAEKELLSDFKEWSKTFEDELKKIFEKQNQTISIKDQSELISDSILIDNNQHISDSYSTTEVTDLITITYRNLLNEMQNNLYNLKREIGKLKKVRLIRYLVFAFSPILIIAIYWLYFRFKDVQTPTSLVVTILIGVGSSLIATFISNISDKYNAKRFKKISKFKEEIRKNNDLKIDTIIKDFRDSNSQRETEISQKILNCWAKNEEKLFKEIIDNDLNDYFNYTIQTKKNILTILELYKNSYTKFNDKVLMMFNEQEESLKKIDSIAATIKEDSIRPSFTLLNNTIEEIKSVKKEIEILDY